MNLIDRTSFIADAKKFVLDMEVVKTEVVDSVAKCKLERQKQEPVDSQERNDQTAGENNLMKEVRVKSEFEKESEKLRQQTEKKLHKEGKTKMGEYYTEKKSKNHLKHVKMAWDKLSSHLNKK